MVKKGERPYCFAPRPLTRDKGVWSCPRDYTHSAGYRMIPILNAVPIPLGPIPIADASHCVTLCSRWTISLSRGSGLAEPSSPATRNQVVNQYYCCDYKECVNQAAADMGDQAQQPKHNQNRDNRPKHSFFLRGFAFCARPSGRSITDL